MRPRLAIVAGAASDFRDSVRRARARRRAGSSPTPGPALQAAVQEESADEVKRRLDETRERLRGQIPPRED